MTKLVHDARIQLLLSQKFKDRYEKIAAQRNMSLNEWTRIAMAEKADRKPTRFLRRLERIEKLLRECMVRP